MKRRPDADPVAVAALLHRVLGRSATFTRTTDGVSTQVYRVQRGTQVLYLRLAEQPGDNLETEAELHERLRTLGVRVAEIVYVEEKTAELGLSVLITTEVPGVPLLDVAATPDVLEQAGADLALINQLPVDGYGFVLRRGQGWPLRGEYREYAEFTTSFLPQPWPGMLATFFTGPELDALRTELELARPVPAVLSHGDFDVTAIFVAAGRYSGLIDFGEIRGAEPTFDLGHFLLHDERGLFPALLRGYGPVHRAEAIRRSAILLGLRQLCRWLGPPRNFPAENPHVRSRVQRLRELLNDPGGA